MSARGRWLLTSGSLLVLLLSVCFPARAHNVEGLAILFWLVLAGADFVAAILKYSLMSVLWRNKLRSGFLAFLLVWPCELAAWYFAGLLSTPVVNALAVGDQAYRWVGPVMYSILAIFPNAFLMRTDEVPTVRDVLTTRWSFLLAWVLGCFFIAAGIVAYLVLGLVL